MKTKVASFVISFFAVLVAIIHLVWPKLTIDSITIALIIIAIIPWLGSLFKSLEFPGGLKVEYHELQKAANKAKKAGLLKPTSNKKTKKKPEFPYQQISSEDPNLALAGLRIEIERRLLKIAESHGIDIRSKGGVASIARSLKEADLLSGNEYSALLDIVVLLNSAVHGHTVDAIGANWAFETGNQILQALDEKIMNKGSRK
ncbi:MAG: hypothetical protein HZB19_21555 [Chloroflexi bacterium]|nr:hypothetical protein [Chloroflexota bacterium]